MTDDSMQVLLRLRRMALDEAGRGLAACLQAETEAAVALRDIDDAIERETAAASDISGDDLMVESFAVWLRNAMQRRETAIQALSAAEAQSAEARTVLIAARAGVRAIEELIARREAEHAAHEARLEQMRLDEAGQRRSRG